MTTITIGSLVMARLRTWIQVLSIDLHLYMYIYTLFGFAPLLEFPMNGSESASIQVKQFVGRLLSQNT